MPSFASALVCLLALIAVSSADVVSTKFGRVNGYSTATHKIWKGIPFAEPPVGNLRFRPPQSPTPWSGVKETISFGSRCPQYYYGAWVGDEDCLTINVWVPKNADLSKAELPVLAYIHGGSFTGGGSVEFEGDFLSGDDVIYVNFNYRVGALGGLYHPALASESGVGTSGAYGLQDQRLAFRWIRENIAAFGGNPNRVTMSAESAGAIALCVHLVAPRSRGLFDQIITESGFCNTFNQADGTKVGNVIASRLNCQGDDVVSCLRSKTPQQIVDASSGIPVFYYTSHPYEVVDRPIEQIEKGNFFAVPILGGTNLNESSYSMCPYFSGYNYDQLVAYATTNYLPHLKNKDLNELLSVYNREDYPTVIANMIAIGSDRSFKCFTKTWFQAASKLVPSFMYSFERVPSYSQGACYGAAHAYELNFIYKNMAGNPLPAEEQALGVLMRDAWVSFTKNGKPTFSNGFVWPAYTYEEQKYVKLNLELSTGSKFRDQYCGLWNQSSLTSIGVSIPTVPADYPAATDAPTVAPTQAPCAGASFLQSRTGSWRDNGKQYSQYQVTVKVGAQPLYAVEIAVNSNGATFTAWNINQEGDNIYTIPDYQYSNGVLPAGSRSVTFGYTISSADPAEFSLNNNACQPKFCSVYVSSAETNRWASGSLTYVQYQVSVRNGSPDTLAKAYKAFEVTFTGGAYVQSSYNIEPATSTATETTKTFTCNVNNVASGQTAKTCGYTIAVPTEKATSNNQRAFVKQAVCL